MGFFLCLLLPFVFSISFFVCQLRFTVYRRPWLGSENTTELSMTTLAEQDAAEMSCRLVLELDSARKKESEFSRRFTTLTVVTY
ncbi:hypothetical protein N665_0156s0004 [Sinapis alba]|nr:hypothetical protein N665_0156s0004 [Sinapis alba]